MRLELEIKPSPLAAARGLDRLAELMTGTMAARYHAKAGELYQTHTRRHLDSEGDATGARFQDLSDRYAARKRREHPGTPILEATGRMRRAILKVRTSTKSMVGGPKGGLVVRRKAAIHLRGAPAQNLPARPPWRGDLSVSRAASGSRVTLGTALLQIMLAEMRRGADAVRPQVLDPIGMDRASSNPGRFTTR